ALNRVDLPTFGSPAIPIVSATGAKSKRQHPATGPAGRPTQPGRRSVIATCTTSPSPTSSARWTTALTGSRYRPSLGNRAVVKWVSPIIASTATWPQYSRPRAAAFTSADSSGSISTNRNGAGPRHSMISPSNSQSTRLSLLRRHLLGYGFLAPSAAGPSGLGDHLLQHLRAAAVVPPRAQADARHQGNRPPHEAEHQGHPPENRREHHRQQCRHKHRQREHEHQQHSEPLGGQLRHRRPLGLAHRVVAGLDHGIDQPHRGHTRDSQRDSED